MNINTLLFCEVVFELYHSSYKDGLNTSLVYSSSGTMYLKKVGIPPVRWFEIENSTPTVAVICPSCGSEVNLHELIEEKGFVRCADCR